MSTADKLIELQLIIEEIDKEISDCSFQEVNKYSSVQLSEIDNAIKRLEQSNYPVPDEFRVLKLNLLQKITVAQETEKLKAKLIEILKPYVTKYESTPVVIKRKYKRKTPKYYGHTLKDLINSGILKAGIKLFRDENKVHYEVMLKSNEELEYKLNEESLVFPSPSTAAQYFSGKPTNGWSWWKTKDEFGVIRKLDYFRQRYINNEA